MKTNGTNIFLTIVITASLTIIVLVVAAIYLGFTSKGSSSEPPTQISQEAIDKAATAKAAAGVPVPTIEIGYIKNGDIAGLLEFLKKTSVNRVSISMNIHNNDIYGIGGTSETVKTRGCDLGYNDFNILCHYATIEYTSVYKGTITAGVDKDFVLSPNIKLKGDWSEVERTQKDNKITIVEGSTAVVTFSGRVCVTSVEEKTPTEEPTPTPDPADLYAVQKEPGSDVSYTIKTRDDRHYWPDFGPSIWPTGINEEMLRVDSYKQAKTMALAEEKIKTIYSFVQDDMLSAGEFYKALTATYTPELAKMYGLKGFEFVLLPSVTDYKTRCDGSNINK